MGKTIYQISFAEEFHIKKTKFISVITITDLVLYVLVFLTLVNNFNEKAISWGFSIGFITWGTLTFVYKARASDYTLFVKKIVVFIISALPIWTMVYYLIYRL